MWGVSVCSFASGGGRTQVPFSAVVLGRVDGHVVTGDEGEGSGERSGREQKRLESKHVGRRKAGWSASCPAIVSLESHLIRAPSVIRNNFGCPARRCARALAEPWLSPRRRWSSSMLLAREASRFRVALRICLGECCSSSRQFWGGCTFWLQIAVRQRGMRRYEESAGRGGRNDDLATRTTRSWRRARRTR